MYPEGVLSGQISYVQIIQIAEVIGGRAICPILYDDLDSRNHYENEKNEAKISESD